MEFGPKNRTLTSSRDGNQNQQTLPVYSITYTQYLKIHDVFIYMTVKITNLKGPKVDDVSTLIRPTIQEEGTVSFKILGYFTTYVHKGPRT